MSLVTEAYLGKLEQLKKLVEGEEKVDINQTDPYGDTALHAASYTGKYTLVTYLLEHGANVNAKNSAGSTPLHKAVVGKQTGIVELLLKYKADSDIKNIAGLRAEYYTRNQSIISALKSTASITKKISVPRDKHGKIIGKKGKTLEGIRKKSGAQITVPKPTDSSDEIVIVGRADEVGRAEELIEEILKKEPAVPKVPDVLPDGWASTELQVPKRNIKFIIGPKGATIQRIIRDTGVNITVPPTKRPPKGDAKPVIMDTENEDKISVVGPVNNVDEAIKIIFECIQSKGTYYDS